MISKQFLSSLSTAVAGDLVLLEFMTSLHRGLHDAQLGRIDADDIQKAGLTEDALFWLLVALSRSAAVITRIAELFPTKVSRSLNQFAAPCAQSELTLVLVISHTYPTHDCLGVHFDISILQPSSFACSKPLLMPTCTPALFLLISGRPYGSVHCGNILRHVAEPAPRHCAKFARCCMGSKAQGMGRV